MIKNDKNSNINYENENIDNQNIDIEVKTSIK